MPNFLNGASLLRSCNNQFYCVLNYWDESLASCAAPQETRLIEVNSDVGGAYPVQQQAQQQQQAQ
jgi:hypothetical protein